MASQSEGIQRLLEAEKEAQKDIDAARRRKYLFNIYFLTYSKIISLTIHFFFQKRPKNSSKQKMRRKPRFSLSKKSEKRSSRLETKFG